MALILLMFMASTSNAQDRSRVDLDDVTIQGELLSDDRLKLLSRSKNSIADEVRFRSSFKGEVLEHLPKYFRQPEGLTEKDF